jgi:DNA polymerase III subunit epsilon
MTARQDLLTSLSSAAGANSDADPSDARLSELEVLVVDCQATGAAPRGHLIEIGWASVGPRGTPVQARLIRLPDAERIPPAVARITGISDPMLCDAVEASAAWRELIDTAAALTPQPAPTLIHFARFEQPFLHSLAAAVPPLDLVCTHEIARRLLPDLPRRSLRALTGYFGRGVGALRRSADHVEATAFVWRELVWLLERDGVTTWRALREWLATPLAPTRRVRRVWPMSRSARLAVPDAPGVYRLMRVNGDVLYVGKASSLHDRVNSHFRHQHGTPERTLEMLSQVRAISFETTASALEAALLEPDEIKRCGPPYNVALTEEDRHLWFTPRDLSVRSPHPSPRCALGPFPSAETLDQFAALAQARSAALGRGKWTPDVRTFEAGYVRLCAAHGELSRARLGMHERLLRLGTRLWREGRRDRDTDDEGLGTADRVIDGWTPEQVQLALEWIALRAALARRRARWLTRLTDVAVVWYEPAAAHARSIVIADGEVVAHDNADADTAPPVPAGHSRSASARRASLTLARFDRLRVLTTELKRLVTTGAPVAVRFGPGPALHGARLARALWWL